MIWRHLARQGAQICPDLPNTEQRNQNPDFGAHHLAAALGPWGGVEIGVIFGEVGKKTPPAKLARDVSPSVDCPGPGTRANE